MAFDLDVYKRAAGPLRYDDLDYAKFTEQPLSPGALRCLRYMCDVETHTVCYLRDLLVTPSHRDPVITTFLTMWAYEEYWHGEALATVLSAHSIATGQRHIQAVRQRLGWHDRLTMIGQSVAGNLIGDDFIAVHMAWGAINEWSTHAGYARLIEVENHPVLTELLTRIMRQETRHVAFYAQQARDRLTRSTRARRLTRLALRRFWRPVGADVMPHSEVRHLLWFLLGGPGRHVIGQLDHKISRLPGLGDLRLVRRAAVKYGIT